MNFQVLNNLPIHDLMQELNTLLNANKVSWYPGCDDQICLNTIEGKESDVLFGRGSLYYDWDKKYTDANKKIVVPLRETPLLESDFKILCNQFTGTLFEDVYNSLTSNYKVGRVRIMNLKPRTCLTWHVDDTARIHFPMKTQDGCFMVIDNEIKFLEQNKWWYANTLKPHTVFNGSNENRYHLVAAILE